MIIPLSPTTSNISLLLAAGLSVGVYVLWEHRRRKEWPPMAPFSTWTNTCAFLYGDRLPDHILDAFDKTGPIFRWRMPTFENWVWICDPDMAKVALEGDPALGIEAFDKGDTHIEFDAVTEGTSMFSLETKMHEWALRRKGAAPAFSAKNLNEIHRYLIRSMELLEEKVFSRFEREDKTWDLADWTSRFTMDVMFTSMFQQPANCLDPDITDGHGVRFLKIFTECLNDVVPRRIADATRKYMKFLPRVAYLDRLAHEGTCVCQELIDKYRATYTQEQIEKDPSVMGFLLRTPYKSDKERIRDMIMFLVAGYDTTSSSMGWGLVMLHKHPHVLAKLRDELDAINPTREAWAGDMLDRCSYLQWVVNETLRIKPVGLFTMRYHPMFGKTVKIGGYTIPPCSVVLISMQSGPRKYVTDGEQFIPERWNPKHPDFEKLLWAANAAPFSLGKRACMGKDFARRELKMFLASVCQRWDIVVEKEDVQRYHLTNNPGHCQMKATKRPMLKDCQYCYKHLCQCTGA